MEGIRRTAVQMITLLGRRPFWLLVVAWSLVCIATTITAIGAFLHSPLVDVVGTGIYIVGVLLGFLALGRRIRDTTK